MLILLIPCVWFAVAAFFVILCRAAATGDTLLERPVGSAGPRIVAAGLALWEDAPTPAARLTRASQPHRTRTAGLAASTSPRGARGHCSVRP